MAIGKWSDTTREGIEVKISFPLTSSTWEKVSAESDACNNVQCPYYKQCFFFKARRQASDAQLLVVNHHLLFADLSARMREDHKEGKIDHPEF